MGFRTLLQRAKGKDVQAMAELVTMYRPLVVKLSIMDGALDEDLYQDLMATLVRCIWKIRFF